MARRLDTVLVVPSAARLIQALRDVGYDFAGAVADLIDNSIAANATKIDIHMEWAGADSWLRIADNGAGMDATTITEALRFGSERSYRPDDLGKFGLGLKTASLSQCRQILLASRMSPNIARLEARRFDLDRIIKDDKWEVEILAGAERPAELVEPLQAGPGTVVMWTKLDRVLGMRAPHGDRAERAVWDMVERLEQHLAMVFHRFLEGDVPGRRNRPLKITINGNRVHPWNPFAPTEPNTQHLQVRDFDIVANGTGGVARFEPWVLPARNRFTTDTEWTRMSGPSKWNQQQGFYVYRANRMIQSGGWSRMRAPDEHTKLARVALDFFPELDTAFGINIAKMRVNLPTALRERLKDPIEDLIRVAKRAYDPKADRGDPMPPGTVSGNGKTPIASPQEKPETTPPRRSSNESGASSSDVGARTEVASPGGLSWPPPPLVTTRPAGRVLDEVAAATGDTAALQRIRDRLSTDHPEVALALGW
jgi:hypothetical protein